MSTIQIVFWIYKVFWIMLVDINLILLNLTQNSLPEIHLEIQSAPWTKVAVCFFYGEPCTHHVCSVKYSKSFLLGRICEENPCPLVIHFKMILLKRPYHKRSAKEVKQLLTLQILQLCESTNLPLSFGAWSFDIHCITWARKRL